MKNLATKVMYACGEKVTENMDKQEKIEEIKQGICSFDATTAINRRTGCECCYSA
jgi:hypothetical protein